MLETLFAHYQLKAFSMSIFFSKARRFYDWILGFIRRLVIAARDGVWRRLYSPVTPQRVQRFLFSFCCYLILRLR